MWCLGGTSNRSRLYLGQSVLGHAPALQAQVGGDDGGTVLQLRQGEGGGIPAERDGALKKK